MDEVEEGRILAELRAMLQETGFSWIAEQAEAALWPGSSDRAIVLALIDAAEAVTVDLAQAELDTMRLLEVDEIVFESDPDPDPDPDPDGDGGDGRHFEPTQARKDLDDNVRIREDLRRTTLSGMSQYMKVFEELRVRLDGLD